jgi:hypothetical protein
LVHKESISRELSQSGGSNTAYAAAGDNKGGISLAPSTAVIDGQTATITYDLLFGASAACNDLSRPATLVDGTWTVGQNDYCDFLA